MAIPRKLTQNFVATEVDDEILIVDLDGGELLSLAGTARAIWRLIDGKRDIARIADELAEPFPGERETIAADTTAFIEELAQARLVEVV